MLWKRIVYFWAYVLWLLFKTLIFLIIRKIKEAKGLGPGGVCKCPKCGHEQPHTRGKPCGKIKCPKCNNIMERKR